MNAIILLALLVFCYTITSAQHVYQLTPMTFSPPQLVDSKYQSKFFYSWNWAGDLFPVRAVVPKAR